MSVCSSCHSGAQCVPRSAAHRKSVLELLSRSCRTRSAHVSFSSSSIAFSRGRRRGSLAQRVAPSKQSTEEAPLERRAQRAEAESDESGAELLVNGNAPLDSAASPRVGSRSGARSGRGDPCRRAPRRRRRTRGAAAAGARGGRDDRRTSRASGSLHRARSPPRARDPTESADEQCSSDSRSFLPLQVCVTNNYECALYSSYSLVLSLICTCISC